MRIDCRAKVNIGLDVLSKKSDGYHNIRSVFASVGLMDTLYIEKSETYYLECEKASVPTDETNLVTRAYRLLSAYVSRDLSVKVQLIKRIPTMAGLGGGSSDSAAALVGINRLYNLKLPISDLYHLASELGADVPFMLEGGLAYCFGKGEYMKKLPNYLDGFYIIIFTFEEAKVSTREAYENIDREGKGKRSDYFEFLRLMREKDLSNMKTLLFNDFERPVFRTYPELEEVKEALYRSGALYSAMTGSGSSIYGIFSSEPGHLPAWLRDLKPHVVRFAPSSMAVYT
jgi:4-diphosphocytidyl-2-C-methyl-D-erythritol kinase